MQSEQSEQTEHRKKLNEQSEQCEQSEHRKKLSEQSKQSEQSEQSELRKNRTPNASLHRARLLCGEFQMNETCTYHMSRF